MTQDKLRELIAALEAERAAYVENAGREFARQVGIYDGQIMAYRRLLEAEPDAEGEPKDENQHQ
jgi:hypothetical protein